MSEILNKLLKLHEMEMVSLLNWEQELLIKKEKVEKILAEKIKDRNWFAKRVGKNIVFGFDVSKSNMDDVDLEIEALQSLIEEIDKELRNGGM